jgi:hypothetical protein
MTVDDLQKAYEIIEKRTIWDNIDNPLKYKVPNIKGIHWGECHKTVKEVKPNTMEYILFYLHDLDYELAIETLMAYLYYWKFRKKKLSKMNELFQRVKTHYTIQNTPYRSSNKTQKCDCVYLIKISIGSKTLYKVGRSKDIHKRMIDIQSDINTNYPLVSVGLEVLATHYCEDSHKLEKMVLDSIRAKISKKNKFFFKGSTEAFENHIVTDIFKQYTN